MSEIVDLDVMVPQPVTIRFRDEKITIEPPRVVDFMILGSLTDKLNDINGLNESQVQKIIDDITERIYVCIPALRGKPLNKAQLQMLINILVQMAQPPITETPAGKITPNTDEVDPKDQSN